MIIQMTIIQMMMMMIKASPFPEEQLVSFHTADLRIPFVPDDHHDHGHDDDDHGHDGLDSHDDHDSHDHDSHDDDGDDDGAVSYTHLTLPTTPYV